MIDIIPEDRPAAGATQRSYTPLVIALAGFVALFVFVLAITFVSSYVVQRDAASINLAGRQRMLSQRIAKGLLQIQLAVQSMGEGTRSDLAPLKLAIPQDDLRLSTELFETTLTAFSTGGVVKGADLKPLQLEAARSENSRLILAEAQSLWQPLRERLAPIIAVRGTADPDQVTSAVNYASDKNLKLLDVMNRLTADLEAGASDLARTLRLVSGVLAAAAIVLLGVVLYQIFGRLRQGDREAAKFAGDLQATNAALGTTTKSLETSKQDTDLIFTTVRQGMMLLDPSLRIGDQYSDEVKRLFRIDDLAGMNFLSLLQRLLPEKWFNTSRDYLALMFDPAKKEKQLAKINPLSQVEVSFPNPEGGFTTNFFEFAFRRIVAGGKVDRLFVSVRDITPQVKLEQQLRSEEAKKERQFEVLLSILHVEPSSLQEFLTHAKGELDRVNDSFKMEDLTKTGNAALAESLREKLKAVYATVHNIKGNASALQLDFFEKLTNSFEDEIQALLNRPRLTGEDLLSVVVRQAELRTAIEEATELGSRIRETVRVASGPGTGAPRDPITGPAEALVSAISLRQGKSVHFDASGFSTADVPAAHRALVKDVLIQLVRNSVVHGIESPAQRTAAGKPAQATMRLTGFLDTGGAHGPAFQLDVFDDGAGLDYPRIRERAVEQKLLTPEQAAAMGDDQTTSLIFLSGFSTAGTTNGDAGRGAGLDLVKRRVVDEAGGDIDIACSPGRSLLFTISLPLVAPGILSA